MCTKSLKTHKIDIITLGCSKNRVDSEVLLTQLKANDMDATHESNKGNIIIINTCGFIDRAKEESIHTILEYSEHKEHGIIDKLFVTGCLSERYRDELMKEMPQVDAFFGTMVLPQLLKKLGADYKHQLIGERFLTTPTHYAYMKIAEGCNRTCTFCAIPLMRGQHVSRPMNELLLEASNLVKNGVKEIILIAQELTYYGLDIYKKRMLADLLQRLADIPGLEWIRLHYAYPSNFPKKILPVINNRSNICKYIDIPLQHANNEVLKAMRRQITREESTELIQQIRSEVDGIAIRTTMMVGFPNETKEAFDDILQFVQEQRFDRLGVFIYSHEEDTGAYTMHDAISDAVKQERADLLMEVQQHISFEINQQKIGKKYKVLIDRKEGRQFIGRTEYDSPEVDNEVLIDA